MISFASLFVGFVLGIVNVQLLASANVARVDLFLDGRPVAELSAPFTTPLDLGCEPAPHELVAVAYDARGKELDRKRQWINRPRATAEASLVLEAGRGGRGRVARLAWRALAGERPVSVAVTFDDVPVVVSDPTRIDLPSYEPAQVHFLRAVLDFGKDVTASAELILGGSRRDEAFSELTAVTVELDEGAELPALEVLAGWLEKDGVPIDVAAAEKGGADLVFVLEGSCSRELQRIYRFDRGFAGTAWQQLPQAGPPPGAIGWQHIPRLATPPRAAEKPAASTSITDSALRLRFLWPVSRMSTQTGMISNVYPITSWRVPPFEDVGRIAGWSLAWPSWTREGQRLADAVAVAGLSAAEGNRRKAVVLLLGPEAMDGSLITPDEASRFLKRLGVPLHVWSVGKRGSPEAPRWGSTKVVSNGKQVDSALRDLRQALDRQRIVWLEGAQLTDDVVLSRLATGVRRTGGTP